MVSAPVTVTVEGNVTWRTLPAAQKTSGVISLVSGESKPTQPLDGIGDGGSRQTKILRGPVEAALFHDASEDAHGIEATHYPNFQIMMSDHG